MFVLLVVCVVCKSNITIAMATLHTTCNNSNQPQVMTTCITLSLCSNNFYEHKGLYTPIVHHYCHFTSKITFTSL